MTPFATSPIYLNINRLTHLFRKFHRWDVFEISSYRPRCSRRGNGQGYHVYLALYMLTHVGNSIWLSAEWCCFADPRLVCAYALICLRARILFPARSYYFLPICKAMQVASKNLHTSVVFPGRALRPIAQKHFDCTVNKIQSL